MPHLQENNDAQTMKGEASSPSRGGASTELPIEEAREGYLSGSESPSFTATASKLSNLPKKVDSFGSTEEQGTPRDTSTPRSQPTKQSVITPSPFGPMVHRAPEMKYGPVVTVYGNTRLVPSPIRVKRRVSNSGEEDKVDNRSPSPKMAQPSNLRYRDMYSTPPSKALVNKFAKSSEKESPRKRSLGQFEFNEAIKKAKTDRAESPDYARSSSVCGDDEASQHSPAAPVPTKKKRMISPTSSGEKGEDDESTGTAPRGATFPFTGRGYPYPPHPPPYASHHHPYGAPPPPYGSAYPMYNGYPPPPPPHYMGGHPPPFYPPYPPHPAMMHHHRPHSRLPPHYAGSPHRMPGNEMAPVTSSDVSKKGSAAQPTTAPSPPDDRSSAIQSVAEWQRAALTTGKPPSAKRCVPLTEPIPSKYWGNAEKTKDVLLPDFHRIVNFPDYLVKARSNSSETPIARPAGKKNCVMCGKLRVCSASSLVKLGKSPKQEEVTSMPQEEDDSTAHIIPRQNKGLCTACDVTVWVVVTDNLEIKWCKGCKNFRPWAAFGDKGSATKCVRCRDRQREKYAMQKDEIRLRRFKRTSSADSSSSSVSSTNAKETQSAGADSPWKEKKDEDTHLAAARGLRNLMNAAAV